MVESDKMDLPLQNSNTMFYFSLSKGSELAISQYENVLWITQK